MFTPRLSMSGSATPDPVPLKLTVEYTASTLIELRASTRRLSATVPEIWVLSSPVLVPFSSRKRSTDQEPVPLMDVFRLSWRSTLPLKLLAILFPAFDKTPPAGPSTGPCTGKAPISPTPGIPESPVVGDCGRKLTESEMLKTQLRVTYP